MGRISKTFALFLTLITVMSCLTIVMVKPPSAQSIPKPSVPEFTVQLVDRSYDEPPTYQKDPSTGQDKLVWIGGHIDNKTIDFTIKNQPFIPYKTDEKQYRTILQYTAQRTLC